MPSRTTTFHRVVLGACLDGDMERAYFQLCYGNDKPDDGKDATPLPKSTTRAPSLDNSFREPINHRPQSRQIPAKTRSSDGPVEDVWRWGWISKIQELWSDCVSVTIGFQDASRCDEYTTPGMYVKMRPFGSDQPLYLAMVNSPHKHRHDGQLEFIVKKSPSAAWIFKARVGQDVQLTQALGNGFNVGAVQDSVDSIIFLAAGTGIAPINAVIDEHAYRWKAQGKMLRLYFGVEGMEDFQLLEYVDDWRRAGVVVTPCVSKRCVANKAAGYTGFVCGHVQHIAADDMKAGRANGPRTAVLMCGAKTMTEEARKELGELGVPENNFLTNF